MERATFGRGVHHIITRGVRWYLAYSLSLRNLAEIIAEC